MPRSHHASCALGSRVYFFGGLDSNQKRLNCIEWFDMENGDRINEPFKPIAGSDDPSDIVLPRELPCFGPVSSTTIAIMGGLGEKGKLHDVVLYEIGNNEVQQSFKRVEENIDLDFVCKTQTSTMAHKDGIIALVKSSDKGNCFVSYSIPDGGYDSDEEAENAVGDNNALEADKPKVTGFKVLTENL